MIFSKSVTNLPKLPIHWLFPPADFFSEITAKHIANIIKTTKLEMKR
jgi:hypothetical protein